MSEILTRYQSFKKTQELTRVIAQERLAPQERDVFTAAELTEKIQRPLEENNIKLLDTTGLDQLEQQLNSFLQQVKIREIELKMGVVKALQDQEMQLKKERKYMMDEIMAAGMDGINNDSNAAEPQPPVMGVHITGMSTLKRKRGDDTPEVRRSGRLVYQKDSDVVDVMGDSSKTKVCVRRSRKLVYQEDPNDDDFVDESLKVKDFGSKNGEKREVKVKEKKEKGKEKMVNKVGDNLEELDRVLLRIPPISLFRIMTNLTEEQRQSNVKRITPAIAFWTCLLNKREMEEISSGGFRIHEQGEKQGNEDGEKQEVVAAEIPST
nr:transcription factor, K-box [Tanacetum cinerariifolium]